MSEVSTPSAPVLCTQCGRPFPVDDVMRFGESYVCADCKASYLQRMREGAPVGQTLHYASFGMRFLALMIDAMLIIVVSLAVDASLGAPVVAQPGQGMSGFFRLSSLVNFVIAIVYEVYFLSTRGATLGKMALGIKIVTPDGGPLSVGRAIGRFFCRNYLEFFTLLIGYLIALFDDQNRTLHDRICGTRAITTR